MANSDGKYYHNMFPIYLTLIFKTQKPRFQKASNLFQVLESTKQEGPGMRQGDQAVSESHILPSVFS